MGKRAQHREEMERKIIEVAEGHLATKGAAALSLRAVASDAGIVPSAIYRYFNGLDQLITALIVRSYRDQTEFVTSQVGDFEDPADWDAATSVVLDIARAVRAWALANPHRYALVYGSPIPGYRAPEETIDAASGVGRLLLRSFEFVWPGGPIPEEGIALWSAIYGLVSFELFGHLEGSVPQEEREGFFLRAVRREVGVLRRGLEGAREP